MSSTSNILILSSDTGGGHRSAAQALESSFNQLTSGRIVVEISRVMEEGHFVTEKLGQFYNYLLREHQDWMKYYYAAIQRLRPYESQWIYQALAGYGKELFQRFCPNVIVSVHPMTQHFFSHLLRKFNLIDKIPLMTVVTDPCYGFWKGWACSDVQQYFVATEEAQQQLVDYGIAQERIQIQGMPVHSRFAPVNEMEKLALRHELGLLPDKFTVFINAGWIGGGNIPYIYQELIATPLDVQVVLVTGHNKNLYHQAQYLAQHAQMPVKVVGYTQDMHKLMNASDVMVSKLGGLTTFEAITSCLPVIADVTTTPMPQEAQTANFIDKTGTGLLLPEPEDISLMVKSLVENPNQVVSMREAAMRQGKPGAIDRIAQDILTCLNKPNAHGMSMSQRTV